MRYCLFWLFIPLYGGVLSELLTELLVNYSELQ